MKKIMMEKEQHDSMATVQMSKADYAASEVYSTTSEPPPAYRRETSSVRIAKIIGLTVVVSSFILGAFILASSYLQARASCDQMQTLDSILEKELMLETLQELPKAEALLSGRDLPSDNDMQSLDNNNNNNNNNKEQSVNNKQKPKSSGSDSESDSSSSSSSDNSFSESDEAEELNRIQIKMPLELSLSDLANAILQQNQKSRMNCVIERRRAEELVDNAPKMTPFGMSFNVEPKKRVTGERMAIFCESGSAIKDDNDNDNDDESIEPRQIPVQRWPIAGAVPYGALPQQYPLTHMPQQQMPSQAMMPPQPPQQQQPQHSVPPQLPFIIRQIIALQHQQQQQQQQTPPQPQQTFMIRPIHMQYPIPEQAPVHAPPQQQQQQPQFIPFALRPQPPQPQPQQQQQPNEIRIHLQRIPLNDDEIQVRQIPIEVIQARPNMIRPIGAVRLQSVNIDREQHQPQQQQQQQQPQPQPQQQPFPPRGADILRNAFGLNSEDIMNFNQIQRIAQEHIEQELRSLAQDESDSSSSEDSQDVDNSDEIAMNLDQQLPINPQQAKMDESKQDEDKSDASKSIQMNNGDDDDTDETDESTQTVQDENKNESSKMMQVQRNAYGRSFQPVKIPVDMETKDEAPIEGSRPHYVQPRSIRDE